MSGLCGAKLDQFVQEAIGHGTVVIDARPCDSDTIVSLALPGPLPPVGLIKR